MIHIIYFIIGFLLGIIGVNILASISELITTALDAIRVRISVFIAKCGSQIKELGGEEELTSSQAIGFAIPQEIEYEEDDDD